MIKHDGKFYARVSSILKDYSDYSNIDPGVLQRKANIGSSVHQAIADDIAGKFPVPCNSGIGYFASYVAWADRMSPIFLQSEKRYFCDEKMITGQIDCLAKISCDLVLVDFKTSASSSPSWIMQAHLYHYLLKVNGQKTSPRMLFLKLDPYGELPQVFEFKLDLNVTAKCMNAIDSFWKKNGF